MSKFYSFAVKDFRKQPFDMGSLKGKVVLVVNVASLCGLSMQYPALESMYKKYKDKGFVILGFPANDFFQEPGEGSAESCQRNYGVSFPIMEKINVNGSNEHPLYRFLKSERPGLMGLQMVKWNFEKFLVDREGKVVDRFMPLVTAEGIEPRVAELIQQGGEGIKVDEKKDVAAL
ncbi:glutathione peroxidase gpx1 [Dinochytrium kinnereticum]|nr:glutathione peroxidase gpx1 [Dinochytrium kinnereticum]